MMAQKMRRALLILMVISTVLLLSLVILGCYTAQTTQSLAAVEQESSELYNALLDQEKENSQLREAGALQVVELSFYCDCAICTGSNETTASGTIPIPGYTVAVDPDVIPLGSRIYIEELGWRVAEDTGGSVTGYDIDVFVATHEEALQRGRYTAYAIIEPPAK